MKIEIPDNVLFNMPKDRELQWAAMTIVQKWVNNYEIRMEKNDASSGRAQYVLRYELGMPNEDFQIFRRAGLELRQQPGMLTGHPDMVIDLSDERLNRWKDSGKHVNQVCGYMCGEEAIAVPLIRRVHPGLGGRWGVLAPRDSISLYGEVITEEDLFKAVDGEWEGIIGYADWRMYLASAMMLPTIEICPNGRNKRWLSKFCNLGYRMIQAEQGNDIGSRIESAQQSIRAMLRRKVEAKCSQVPAQIGA